jgi:hypothetical protein
MSVVVRVMSRSSVFRGGKTARAKSTFAPFRIETEFYGFALAMQFKLRGKGKGLHLEIAGRNYKQVGNSQHSA